MPQSSENLVKEILNGNEAAMELLVRQNYDMVQSFIYRYIGDYNTSYDMTQEVFIKMMKNLSRFKYENGNFKSYILKIASNQCRDYFRSSSYKASLESSDIYETNVESGELVIDILERNEERLKVKNAVSSLPEKQREAVILKYFHDMKIKEIAGVTGDNENTIKARLFSGIKNLKKMIGGEYDEKRRVSHD